MQKRKQYDHVKFSGRIIRRAVEKMNSIYNKAPNNPSFIATIGDEQWEFDEMDEFLATYADKSVQEAAITLWWAGADSMLSLFMESGYTAVRVRSPLRSTIESIFTLFEEALPEDRIALQPSTPKSEIIVFIGHGHSKQWEKLKSHLQDKHGIRIEAFETGARAGHAIRDILDNMTKKSSLALLVLTGEDKTETAVRARQNVIHECGLFQGRVDLIEQSSWSRTASKWPRISTAFNS
jgi:hypothetical protein